MRRRTQVTPPRRDRRGAPRVSRRQPLRARLRRLRRRIADPRFYLRAVIVAATLGLVVLPYGTDGLNLALGPRGAEGCRVATVIDGDTATLWCPGLGLFRARLTGYDSPEVFSPRCLSEFARGNAATWALRRLLFGAGTLTVTFRGSDRYGRRLVALQVDGVPVARQMIAAGHGRAYGGGRRSGWCG